MATFKQHPKPRMRMVLHFLLLIAMEVEVPTGSVSTH